MALTSRLELEVDSRDAEQDVLRVRKGLEALEALGVPTQRSMEKAAAGMSGMGKTSSGVTSEVQAQRAELEKLLGRLDPLRKKQDELAKSQAQLAAAYKNGDLNEASYKRFSGVIRDQASAINTQREALGKSNSVMSEGGMTAKQLSNSLLGVPAQFTDIFTSLQGGQSPLTVFLQQGGQLKDMFGGVAPAAKALGGYIVGLINPFSLAAAAVAALGLAYYQGSKEADAYNAALITTGNAAGTTSSTLGEMAKRVSTTVGTTSQAAEALALLAGNGKIARGSFEEIATAAVSFEKTTGKAVANTVAEFAKLADDPAKAAAELNEKYNFLTASVYEQILAAQQMGEKEAAAAIAQDALASALKARSAAMTANLGDIERAWRGIVGAAKEGWDAMLGVGRQQSLDDQIANTQKILDDRNSGVLAKMFPDDLGAGSESSKFLEQKLKVLIKQRDTLTEQGKVEGDNARIQREGLVAYEAREKNKEANFTKEQKRNKALEDELKRINAARAAGYTITQQDEAASLKAIRENSAYQESAPKKEKAYTEDSGQKMLDEARQRFAVLQQQGKAITDQTSGTATLGTEAKKLIELETMLADLKTKGTLTASQKQILAMGELNVAQQKLNAGLEKQNQLSSAQIENAAKLKAYQDGLNAELSLAQEGLDNQNSGDGLGDRAKSRLQDDLRIRQDYQKKINKLTNDYTDSTDKTPARKQLYDDDVTAAKGALDRRLAMQQDSYAKEEELRNNWLAGTSTAWQNYVDIATNYNQQANDATAQLLGDTTLGISDQISGLLRGTVTLSEAFDNLGTTMSNSIMTALSDIAAQWVVTQALKMAGITAEAGAVVAAEGVKTTAKVTGDAISTGSTLVSLATTTAASVASAATTMASWLPTALVASIGTFGAAAVVGGAGLLAAFALIKGFSDGGYTGSGGVNEPAGVVHKGEVVWSQADIRRSGGVSAVESLRKGNVSPMAGSAAGSSLAAPSSAQTGTAQAVPPITQQFNFQGTPDDATISLVKDAAYQGAKGGYEMVMRDLKQNGPIRQLIRR